MKKTLLQKPAGSDIILHTGKKESPASYMSVLVVLYGNMVC